MSNGTVAAKSRAACLSGSDRARRGFTLVELLVVIGIIAVLVSILLPSLNAARRQAEAIKCGAALREIGNAFAMYAIDSKGYYPPARTGSIPYHLNDTNYANAFWYDFLVRYVAKGKKLNTSSTTGAEAADAQNSVFWGCPSFAKYESTAIGGFNRQQTGYGINHHPTFTQDYPANITTTAGDADMPPSSQSTLVSMKPSGTNWSSQNIFGLWPKTKTFTNPSRRALIGDSQFWLLESRWIPDTNIPGQKVFRNGTTYSAVNVGQSLMDWYRHGKFPGIADGYNNVGGSDGRYKTTGGKVSYNILYADGHVDRVVDREETFRSTRMKFPG